MDIQWFYKKYNVGKGLLALLAGTTIISINKYEKDDLSLRNKTEDKIKKAIRVIEKYNLVHPEYRHNFSHWRYINEINDENRKEYVERFKKLYAREYGV